MLRATFFATGLFVVLWGATFLYVESVNLKDDGTPAEQPAGMLAEVTQTVGSPPRLIVKPPDWAAFSLLAIGGVTLIYALALPKKKRAGG